MCVQSLGSMENYLNSSISHLRKSNSMVYMEEILTWLSASLIYHITCMDETSHCLTVEDMNISLGLGNQSMVHATNSVAELLAPSVW